MVVVPHQHKRMDAPAGARTSLPERLQKTPPIRIILEDRLAPIPTIQHMINSSPKFNACFSGHKRLQIPTKSAPANKSDILKLTPPRRDGAGGGWGPLRGKQEM